MNSRIPGFETLAKLETFDPNVFVSDDKETQEVCNFVLVLALVYNDYKNLIWAWEYFKKTEKDIQPVTAYNGQYGGFQNHLMKLQFSLLNEVFQLIEYNKKIILSAIFQETLRKIPKNAKTSWQEVYNIAFDLSAQDKSYKEIFHKIRNKVCSHWDTKCIKQGYMQFFKKCQPGMQAFISRGGCISDIRFYFADAAVEGYLYSQYGGEKATAIDFLKKTTRLMDSLNMAFYHIVVQFIQVREGCFRDYK